MIDFAPESVEAEVMQNVRTILATRRGTVPLDRALGISWDHLDAPLPVAKIHTMSDVIDALRAYEPRAVIENVEILSDTEASIEGALRVRVTFSMAQGAASNADKKTYTAEASSA